MMRSMLLAALVSVAVPAATLAQTADELKNDEKTPGDVLTYGMGYGLQRFSPLTQINRDNVKRLVPAWSYSMADNNGQQSHALVKDGVIYITDHAKTVALDAMTGKEIWKSVIEYPPETTRIVCCGIVNRGSAMLEGKLFRTTLDANVIALDTKTGKELWRTKSADHWADGVDLETGRPVWSAETKSVFEKGAGHKVRIWPALVGGKNWAPMSYSPLTKLAYVNSTDFGWDYEAQSLEELAKLKPGVTPYFGVKREYVFDHPDGRGHLRAIDPLTGKSKWAMPLKSPNMAGTMVTAGGLVFTGQLTGEFVAVDAETGKLLWQYQLGAGSVGQPVTWERNGKQYITMTSGSSGPYVARVGDPNLANVPPGGMVWTFKLFED
jgi:glucose dehydrogenase